MTTIQNRNRAKGLVSALLLSAALVPAAAMAAPGHGKGHPDKNVKHEQKRVVQQQKQVMKQQKQVAKQQRQVQKAQARPGKVVYVAPAAPRTVVRERVVTRAPRTVYVAAPQARNRGRWEGWNRQYNRYGSNRFQLDGTFFDQQYGCVLVRDHQGQVIPLVGNPGDLRRGEHLLLSGRVETGTVCGTAFRVYEVNRVWADASHRRVLYDNRADGNYGDYGDRYGRYNDRDRRYDDRNDRYDNDRYGNDRYDNDRYDDRYDRGRNERLVSVDGRIDRGSRCDTLRADNGDRYGLAGDIGDYRDGERVRVIGFLGGRSACGSRTIDVQEIRDR